MNYYLLFKLGHILGFILVGGGLLGVFVCQLRSQRSKDLVRFADAAQYTAIFYDLLVLPGAFLVSLSGLFLIEELGLGFFAQPWLAAMWGLFLFEFVEGNTITRLEYHRTLRLSLEALDKGSLGDCELSEAKTLLGRFTHFLDLPLFTAIVYCGVIRPDTWWHVSTVIAIALILALILTSIDLYSTTSFVNKK